MATTTTAVRVRDVSSWLPALITFLAVAAAWQWLPSALGVQPYVFPSIGDLVRTFQENWELLTSALVVTTQEALYGLLIGLGLGAAFGTVCHYVRPIRTPATTLLVALTSVPLIGLAPIAVLVFGPGMMSKIVLVAFVTVFTMTLYTISALSQVPGELERLLLAFKTPEPRIFFVLRVPSGAPHFLTGVKFAAGQAVLMAIVGELFSAQDGLGAVILQQSALSGYDVMWAASIAGAATGLVFFLAASAISWRLTRWI